MSIQIEILFGYCLSHVSWIRVEIGVGESGWVAQSFVYNQEMLILSEKPCKNMQQYNKFSNSRLRRLLFNEVEQFLGNVDNKLPSTDLQFRSKKNQTEDCKEQPAKFV